MAPAPQKANANPQKPQAKLSSGILGMKFMQKDESATPPPPSPTPEPSSESKTKFQHEKDPSEWFAPLSKPVKHAPAQGAPKSVGFSEMYGSDPTTQGRRSYGAKPNIVDPEQMADTDNSEDKKKRRKSNKKGPKQPSSSSPQHTNGRKRLSETEAEGSSKRTVKRSRT